MGVDYPDVLPLLPSGVNAAVLEVAHTCGVVACVDKASPFVEHFGGYVGDVNYGVEKVVDHIRRMRLLREEGIAAMQILLL